MTINCDDSFQVNLEVKKIQIILIRPQATINKAPKWLNPGSSCTFSRIYILLPSFFFFFLNAKNPVGWSIYPPSRPVLVLPSLESQDSTSHWRSSFRWHVTAPKKGKWMHRELCHQAPWSAVLPNQVNHAKGHNEARAQVQQIRESLCHSVKGKSEVLCKSDGEILKTETMTLPLSLRALTRHNSSVSSAIKKKQDGVLEQQ